MKLRKVTFSVDCHCFRLWKESRQRLICTWRLWAAIL